MAAFDPEFLAIEPPELIGTGIAVSKARPELVRGSVTAAERGRLPGKGPLRGRNRQRRGRSGGDETGNQGILVASSVVKAKDWEGKLRELSSALLASSLAGRILTDFDG